MQRENRPTQSRNAARRAAKKRQRSRAALMAQHRSQPIPSSQATVDQRLRHEERKVFSLLDDIARDIDSDGLKSEYQRAFARFTLPRSAQTDVEANDTQSRWRRLSQDEEVPSSGEMSPVSDEQVGQKFRTFSGEKAGPTRMRRTLKVAVLKAVTRHPHNVDWTDTSSPDPFLLNELKSARNAVPVPAHWSSKREYLSGKRGIEKTGFVLPDFIRNTGITEMREAANEQREQQSLKQQMRSRVQPKLGRLDIDYQKLHDAFFRFQTKPLMTGFGAAFYEGKEFESTSRDRVPGQMSEDLKAALGMPPGAPPPWLITMQRLGPPPSYPSIRIPGINAPLPSGAQWGYHPGGWGKPPTDEYNRPLYGDVFGIVRTADAAARNASKTMEHWGEMDDVDVALDERADDGQGDAEGADETSFEGDNDYRQDDFGAREVGTRSLSTQRLAPPDERSAAPDLSPITTAEIQLRKAEFTSSERSLYTASPEHSGLYKRNSRTGVDDREPDGSSSAKGGQTAGPADHGAGSDQQERWADDLRTMIDEEADLVRRVAPPNRQRGAAQVYKF